MVQTPRGWGAVTERGFPGWHRARSYTREASVEEKRGVERRVGSLGRGTGGAAGEPQPAGHSAALRAWRKLVYLREDERGLGLSGAHTLPSPCAPNGNTEVGLQTPAARGCSPVPRVGPLFPTAGRRSADLGLASASASASEGSSQRSQVGGSQLSPFAERGRRAAKSHRPRSPAFEPSRKVGKSVGSCPHRPPPCAPESSPAAWEVCPWLRGPTRGTALMTRSDKSEFGRPRRPTPPLPPLLPGVRRDRDLLMNRLGLVYSVWEFGLGVNERTDSFFIEEEQTIGRETDPALPPQTPFSPSFPATASPFSVALLRESRRMNPRGICLRLAPPGLEGGREIKRPATRLENHLGLNSCSPLAARWLGRQRESPRVRAAPPRLPRDARTRSTTAASEAPHDCGVLSQRTLVPAAGGVPGIPPSERHDAPGSHPEDLLSPDSRHARPRIRAPPLPSFPGRLQLPPGADTHLPQKGPPGGAAQTRPRWRGAELGKVTGPTPGKLLSPSGIPGAADMVRRSTSSTTGERILAEVQLRPRGVCKTRGRVEPALSARPEPRASACLRPPTPPQLGARRLAGPSPSSRERPELRSRPRPSPGCPPRGVRGFSSSPASPSGGRPAAARGPRAWLRLRARRPLMVHSVYLCLDSNWVLKEQVCPRFPCCRDEPKVTRLKAHSQQSPPSFLRGATSPRSVGKSRRVPGFGEAAWRAAPTQSPGPAAAPGRCALQAEGEPVAELRAARRAPRATSAPTPVGPWLSPRSAPASPLLTPASRAHAGWGPAPEQPHPPASPRAKARLGRQAPAHGESWGPGVRRVKSCRLPRPGCSRDLKLCAAVPLPCVPGSCAAVCSSGRSTPGPAGKAPPRAELRGPREESQRPLEASAGHFPAQGPGGHRPQAPGRVCVAGGRPAAAEPLPPGPEPLGRGGRVLCAAGLPERRPRPAVGAHRLLDPTRGPRRLPAWWGFSAAGSDSRRRSGLRGTPTWQGREETRGGPGAGSLRAVARRVAPVPADSGAPTPPRGTGRRGLRGTVWGGRPARPGVCVLPALARGRAGVPSGPTCSCSRRASAKTRAAGAGGLEGPLPAAQSRPRCVPRAAGGSPRGLLRGRRAARAAGGAREGSPAPGRSRGWAPEARPPEAWARGVRLPRVCGSGGRAPGPGRPATLQPLGGRVTLRRAPLRERSPGGAPEEPRRSPAGDGLGPEPAAEARAGRGERGGPGRAARAQGGAGAPGGSGGLRGASAAQARPQPARRRRAREADYSPPRKRKPGQTPSPGTWEFTVLLERSPLVFVTKKRT
eukprot:XP_022282820.1 collagen alpha-1(I) chain-like [Canis lupus familiaris]